MTIEDIYKISAAVLTSLGGGALIIAAFSTWLGKVWASRILEKDRAKYKTQIEILKSDLSKKIHEHNVAISRIDIQRAEAIQQLFTALIVWFEVSLNIRAPSQKLENDKGLGIKKYQEWALELESESLNFAKLSMQVAILLKPETYDIISNCGHSISSMSNNYCHSILSSGETDTETLFDIITTARAELEKEYKNEYESTRATLIEEFRSIMDPTINLE